MVCDKFLFSLKNEVLVLMINKQFIPFFESSVKHKANKW